jgi:PQQ-like domain
MAYPLREFRRNFRRRRSATPGWILFFLPVMAWADWPQAAGPDGNWQGHGPAAPVHWSVAREENILWRTALPNGGQSGIAVAGGRVFLTTFAGYKEGDPKFSGTILGHCLDAGTGKILWSVKLQGPTESPMMYAYSDSTSPTPITDGEHVWFFNASGEMGCWDFQGREIWRRSYTPWPRPFPFNKQHEPILFGDVILNVEPPDGNPAAKNGWNYLRAIDKNTGRTRWIADDGTTSYCTSVFGHTADGRPAVLTGRGGWHGVPETPVGLSLIDLSPGHEGKTIWRFVADTDADGQPLKEPGSLGGPTWQSLYTLFWDADHAYWFRLNPEETHLVFDSHNGKLVREQSLIRGVDWRQWDPVAHKYIANLNVNLREMRELAPDNLLAPDEVIRVMPAWSCNIVVNGYHYFLTTVGKGRNDHPPKGRAGPSHCIARVNIATGKVEYLEVPVTVIRKPGVADEPIYGISQRTSTLNAQGQDVAAEDRSRTDGWEIPAFWGNAVAVNDRIYVTTMLGITYVIDSKAAVLDESALLAVNDLGPAGETWSLNAISYDQGRIYHRSLKEVVCIAEKGGVGAPRNLAAYSPAALPGRGLDQHPFFYTGQWDFRNPVQRMVIVRGGKITWSYEIPTKDTANTLQELSDATLLSNGNVVFARKTGAGEITPDKKLIWNYDAPKGCEVHVAQPIGRDRVMLVQNGEPAKLMVINIVTGATEQEFVLPTGNPHPTHTQFRRVQMTRAGTFLAAHHDQDKVVEYDATGKEIWSVAVPVPWDAVRLANGNTLVSSHNSFVREVNPQGETVWEFSQQDVPDIALFSLQEANRLANGNTVISNWVPNGIIDAQGVKDPSKWPTSVQVLEVTPAKKVVWALRSWTAPADLGPATVIQLLDEPGIPENREQQR